MNRVLYGRETRYIGRLKNWSPLTISSASDQRQSGPLISPGHCILFTMASQYNNNSILPQYATTYAMQRTIFVYPVSQKEMKLKKNSSAWSRGNKCCVFYRNNARKPLSIQPYTHFFSFRGFIHTVCFFSILFVFVNISVCRCLCLWGRLSNHQVHGWLH